MRRSAPRWVGLVISVLAASPVFAQTRPPVSLPSWYRPVDHEVSDAFKDDIREPAQRISAALQNPQDWADPEKRRQIGAAIADDLKTIVTRAEPLLKDGKDLELWSGGAGHYLVDAEIFGSDALRAQLEQAAPPTGFPAIWLKTGRAAAEFYASPTDPAAQLKAVDRLAAIVRADQRAVSSVAPVAMTMYLSKPSKEVSDRVEDFYTNTLRFNGIAKLKEKQEAVARTADLVGKPLALEGRLADGSRFSTADLKGKVVLVDFWATWCGPCKKELPRVKKAYAELHGKGLEVIGVSFDQTGAALSKFLADNPDMPWRQFFDPAHPFWQNEFGQRFGIQGIPVMLLIDRKGVCRSVTARDDLETLIPKLLAED